MRTHRERRSGRTVPVIALILALEALLVLAFLGCNGEADAPPRTEADRVADAEEMYDAASYDTVTWASDAEALARGRDVFAWACAECHGPGGAGDGGRVIDGDTLRPPSFLAADWQYANDPEALHHRVFIGNASGMPHWGIRQMRPRDIVAVERYIRLELRSAQD